MTQVSIFFGSQSGTAQCFAEELQEACDGEGISAEVFDLKKFEPQDFAARKIVILVVSTHGDGAPPDNAVAFHQWASNPQNNGFLKGQRFSVMGLGDMNYTFFNNMGVMTESNLDRLGSKRIYRRGIGDDCQDIHEHFEQWMAGGLWEALKEAIAAVEKEGGFNLPPSASLTVQKKDERDFHIFFGVEESGGACQEVCDALTAKMKEVGIPVKTLQTLTDRKAVDILRKLPSQSVILTMVDAGLEGICAPGRKIVRNMNLDVDAKSLGDKEFLFAPIFVAACGGEDKQCCDAILKHGEGVTKAFERVGATACPGMSPIVVDAASDDAIAKFLEETSATLLKVKDAPSSRKAAPPPAAAMPTAAPAAAPAAAKPSAPAAQPVKILFAGEGLRESGEAASKAWPGGNASADVAALASLVAAAQKRTQVVLIVECGSDGLADASKGLAAQLNAAPLPMKAQLRQLRFALLVLGEGECADTAEPVRRVLTAAGAVCSGRECSDPMGLDFSDSLPDVCRKLLGALQPGVAGTAAAPAAAAPQAAPAAPQPPAAKASTVSKTPVLHMAASASELPAEAEGEPSDVLANFYFEATKTKVLKVSELRQRPDAAQGLSTVEVEIEACGDSLSSYSLGGTLSVLPENDPADVKAMLAILGMSTNDLTKAITFLPETGASKLKKPFPTPCTVAEALGRYCDLGKAPTKRMLQLLEPKIKDESARERVKLLLGDAELLKRLQAAPVCCRMPEFFQLLDIKGLDLGTFLLLCPRQKVREFTIASSPKASQKQLSICVSLSSHEMPDIAPLHAALKEKGIATTALPSSFADRNRFFGMCSRWITTRLKAGDTLLAKHHTSAFHLPAKDVPVIMIGSGAGVAPFRGFWEELRRGPQSAPAALFFGCRNADQDWLYKEEMRSAVKLASSGCAALAKVQAGPKRPLQNLFTAFSRPSEGQKGEYVQDQVKAQAVSVRHWMEKMDGSVYICGSSAMGNGVLDALGDALEGGRAQVDALRKEGRIVAEMWG